MPDTPNKWLNPFIVNQTTGSTQANPRITQLANGYILVTWDSTDNTGVGSPAGLDVIGQIFDPLGQRVGTEFLVNSSLSTGAEATADIAALPDGGFLSVFSRSLANVSHIVLQRHNATGTVTQSDLAFHDITSSAAPSGIEPAVAVSSATSALVVWTESEVGGDVRIVGRIYDPSTETLGAAINLVDIAGSNSVPAVTVLGNGNYVIACETITGSNSQLTYRIVNAAGSAVIGATAVPATTVGTNVETGPVLAALAGGGFVMAWGEIDAGFAGPLRLKFQYFDDAGTPQGSVIEADAIASPIQPVAPALVPLSDGGFMVFYDSSTEVLGMRFDANGIQVGLNFAMVSGAGAGSLDAELLDDGRVAISLVLDSGEIGMMIIDTRDAANADGVYAPQGWQVGTIGADTILADQDGGVVAGHLGSDLIDARNGADTIYGGDGDDTIRAEGAGESDSLYGGASNDRFVLSNTYYTGDIYGGAGTRDLFDFSNFDGFSISIDLAFQTYTDAGETFVVSDIEDVSGGNGNDNIIGNFVANMVSGGDGNDTLIGGAGENTLNGGEGDDLFTKSSFATDNFGDGGNDTFRLSDGYHLGKVYGGDGTADVLDASALSEAVLVYMPTSIYRETDRDLALTGVENVIGSAVGDEITGDSADNNFDGRGGNDSLWGGDGNDTLTGADNPDLLYGGGGNDELFGGGDRDILHGDEGDDTLSGSGDINILYGGDGDDLFRDNSGLDFNYGGDGNDTFVLPDGPNFGSAHGDGGTADHMDFSAVVSWTLSVYLDYEIYSFGTWSSQVFGIEIVTGGALSDIIVGADEANTFDGRDGADMLDGGMGEDGLIGGAGNDTLIGGGDNDVLNGNADDDSLSGGSGDDEVNGADGDDELAGEDGGDFLFGGDGADIVDGGANDDHIHGGRDSDLLTGGDGADTLSGGGGIDELIGGSGVDSINGDAGNDTIEAGEGVDITDGGDGIDTLQLRYVTADITFDMTSGAAGVLGNHIQYERVRLGSGTNFVTGTIGDDSIFGGSGIDSLYGGDGSDSLDGSGGNNTLVGGGGSDSLTTGGGSHSVDGGLGDDLIRLFADSAVSGTFTGGADTDTLSIETAAALQGVTLTGIERLLTNGNTVTALAAQFDAFAAIRHANTQTTTPVTLILAASGAATTLNLSDELANGGGPRAVHLTGSTDAETLTAGAADDTIFGMDGADRLNGGLGSNVLVGGAGNDTFVVNSLGDQVFETETLTGTTDAGGIDTVQSSISFSLNATAGLRFVEHLTLTGTDALNATGNALSNRLTGNSGNNRLDGGLGTGTDTLVGGAGIDTYIVRAAGTQIVEDAGGGTGDIVAASVSFALAADDHIEQMQTTSGTGTGAINLTGNALAQRITGNAGANWLDGGAGNDTLSGLGGADVFVFSTALGATNIDSVTDYNTIADRIEIDNAVFTGLTAGALAGGAFVANLSGLATNAVHRIIYESDTGILWYDRDGSAAGFGRIQFADLAGGLAMTASEFSVV